MIITKIYVHIHVMYSTDLIIIHIDAKHDLSTQNACNLFFIQKQTTQKYQRERENEMEQ